MDLRMRSRSSGLKDVGCPENPKLCGLVIGTHHAAACATSRVAEPDDFSVRRSPAGPVRAEEACQRVHHLLCSGAASAWTRIAVPLFTAVHDCSGAMTGVERSEGHSPDSIRTGVRQPGPATGRCTHGLPPFDRHLKGGHSRPGAPAGSRAGAARGAPNSRPSGARVRVMRRCRRDIGTGGNPCRGGAMWGG